MNYIDHIEVRILTDYTSVS